MAMLAPVVLGGGLLVVSLAGIEVGGRTADGVRPRAEALSVRSEGKGAVSGPDVVYERVVEVRARRGGEVKWEQGVGRPEGVPEGRRGSGKAREKGAKRRSEGRGDGKKERPGEECPPEVEDGVREVVGEVEGEREVISELWLGVVGTEVE
ncbi:hypothetical protein AB0K60_30625 [Thermopolyspora sp. NPDC052614]|uniref:hypothetical protein n=1 Tax=Thermopolyspora sp. NPDC052614 TaxID=3155682 RepID=UPI003413AF39